LGRRRRRVVRIVKKKLPTVFVCPRCGEEAVRVTIAKDTGRATVMCALCQLKDEFQAHPAAHAIDVYSFFADRFYGVKEPRAIIPHDREVPSLPPEEESLESELEEAPLEPSAEPSPLPEESLVPNPDEEPEVPIRSSQTQEITSPTVEEPAIHTEESPEVKQTAKASQVPSENAESVEEENEPFADILGSSDKDKDKKRYSPNPLPQSSEQATQTSD
jgi:transcription elongation factor Elf1